MATPFEAFVNAELPKRVYTQDSPLSWPAGKVVVSTGTGLSVSIQDFPQVPVTSVNSQIGDVSLTYSDVGAQQSLGFTPENVTNKDTDGALTANSDTKYPSQKAVKTYSDSPKSSVWRVVDSTDTSKKLALNLSAVGTATTKTLTMPNADVDLGKVPTTLSYSAGTLTLGTAGGVNLTASIPSTGITTITGSFTATVNTTYELSRTISGSLTMTLPTSGLQDKDWIVIRDSQDAFNLSTGSWTNVTAFIANAGPYWFGPVGLQSHTQDLKIHAALLNPLSKIRLEWVDANNTWNVSIDSSESYLPEGIFMRNPITGSALGFSLTGLNTGKIITMPNANVNLSYVPASFSVSGGVATMTGAGGNTLSMSVYDPNPITTSSGLNLVAGRVYQCSADISSYTINLPAAPADGDWVVIKDTPPPKDSRIGSGVGIITLNGGTKNVTGPDGYSVAPTVQITGSNVHGCERFTYLYAYSSSAVLWYLVNLTPNTQYLSPFARVLANPYLGLSGAYTAIVNYATANRTLSLPDYNIDLLSYKTLPSINTANGNVSPGGTTSSILAGTSNKANKSNQAVLAGVLINSSGLCPEDAALFGNGSVVHSASKVTGYVGSLKGSSTGTAASSLVTASNTKVPAYLTKPTGHHAVSIFEFVLSHTTSAGKVWYGKRRVCVRWDGTTASLDTQTVGTDWDPDTQTITFTPTVSSGLLDISMANSSAAGGDTCYWQCTYEAHHNGG